MRDERRQTCSDNDSAGSWIKLTQKDIHAERSQLPKDVEDEVLRMYQVADKFTGVNTKVEENHSKNHDNV